MVTHASSPNYLFFMAFPYVDVLTSMTTKLLLYRLIICLFVYLLLFQLYTRKLPLDPDIDLQAVATSCNGYVGADLEALCREAAMSAIQRSNAIAKTDGVWFITMDDWMLAKSCVGPSITRGVTVEIPKVSWDDIGGLNDLKVSSCFILLFWRMNHCLTFVWCVTLDIF